MLFFLKGILKFLKTEDLFFTLILSDLLENYMELRTYSAITSNHLS